MGLSSAQVDKDPALVDDIDLDGLDFGDVTDDADAVTAPETIDKAEAAVPEKAEESAPKAEVVAAEPEKAAADKAEQTETTQVDEPEVGKSAGIPKHRFDFVQQKRREAEERAAALEAEIAKLRGGDKTDEPKKNIDEIFAEMDLQIAQATLDGDAQKVAQLRGEQRRMELQMIEQRTAQIGDQTVAQAQEMQRLNEVIDKLESMYPQFVEGGENYDKDLVEEVLDMHSAFVAKGTPPSQAMAKASAYVLRAHGLINEGSDAPPTAPKTAEVERKTDIKKNVAAASAIPPDISKAGVDSAKAGVTKKLDLAHMSIEDFERLGEKDLMDLRGDYDV